jgi:hypothetical protein
MVPSIGLPHHHLNGVRWEASAVIAEVEPPLLPIRIVGGHGAEQVQLLARAPQCERQAAGVNCLTRPLLTRGESVKLATEKVEPEIPVRRDPQVSFADGDEASCL